MAGEPAEIEIVRLGAQGDGIAETTEGGPRFVPFALPGERVRVADDESMEIVAGAHPQRRTPICRHFGTCGGCVAQHMSEDLYAEWKRGIVVEAFRQRGLAPEIAPLLRVPAGSRRRAVLTAKRAGEKITLGYHGRRSHALFDLEECPVLLPEIVAALPALRAVAGLLPAEETRFTVLATPAGLDVAVDGKSAAPTPAPLPRLARIAAQSGLARITLGGETLIERAAPVLQTSGVDVAPPPGAFVQAVAAAEDALVSAVLERIGKPKRTADLFCGVGTFALALARRSRVTAFDSDARSIAALQTRRSPRRRSEAGRGARARPVPRAPVAARACRVRRRGSRSAAGRRQGPMRGAGRARTSPASSTCPAIRPRWRAMCARWWMPATVWAG